MKNKKMFGQLIIMTMVISILLVSCAPQPNELALTEPPEPVETAEPVEPAEPVVPEEPMEPEEPVAADVVVTMSSREFLPAQITVEAGMTVRWDNTSNVAHTVTSGTRGSPTGDFDANLQPGESFSYTFEEPGVVDYYCIPHPGMDGVVTVE